MGYFTLSGNLAMAFGTSFGLFLADILTFQHLLLFCSVLSLVAWIMASTITYKKVDHAYSPFKTNRFPFMKKALLLRPFLFFHYGNFGRDCYLLTMATLYSADSNIPDN
ncbi:hypothetical protein LJR015_000476 [Peribacillus frigoritolerans]